MIEKNGLKPAFPRFDSCFRTASCNGFGTIAVGVMKTLPDTVLEGAAVVNSEII